MRTLAAGSGTNRRARLSDPELQPVALELELRQIVLPHQLQDPLDVLEFHQPPHDPGMRDAHPRSSARQHFAAVLGHQHVVFDPHAAEPFDVRARARP